MTGPEIMEFYSQDLHMREYVPIIRDKEYYPIIYDKNGVVLSLPPLINSMLLRILLTADDDLFATLDI